MPSETPVRTAGAPAVPGGGALGVAGPLCGPAVKLSACGAAVAVRRLAAARPRGL